MTQRQDAGAFFNQGFGQVRADETVGARYENSFPVQQHVSPWRFTTRAPTKSRPLVRPLAIPRRDRWSSTNTIRYLPPIVCLGAIRSGPSCIRQF